MNIEIDNIRTKGPSVKTTLVLALLYFVEQIQTVQDQWAQKDSHNTKLGLFIAELCAKRKFIDFSCLIGHFEAVDLTGQQHLPTPHEALLALSEDLELLHLESALCNTTRRHMFESLKQTDVRLYQDRALRKEACLLSLYVGNSFAGEDTVVQLQVNGNGTLDLAYGLGIKSILDPHGVWFTHNERLRNREFPTSIALRYSPLQEGMARLETVYTWAGGKREHYGCLMPYGLDSQPQFVLE